MWAASAAATRSMWGGQGSGGAGQGQWEERERNWVFAVMVR